MGDWDAPRVENVGRGGGRGWIGGTVWLSAGCAGKKEKAARCMSQ